MTPRPLFVFSALVAGTIFATAARAASLTDTAEVTLTPTDTGGTGPFSQITDAPGAITLAHTATGGLASTGSATVHVLPGIIQLQGAAAGSIDVTARGVYRDNFTITSPGIATGTNGNLTIEVGIDGMMEADAGVAQSRWILNAEVGGGALQNLASGNVFIPADVNSGDPFDPFGMYFMTVPFQFGVATELEVELIGLGHARYVGSNGTGAAGDATFNFGQEFFWQGMLGIRPVGGNPLSDVSLTSDSGVNWLEAVTLPAPVPEPASAAFLIVPAMLLRQRYGRKSRVVK